MTHTPPSSATAVVARAVLNYPLIRARVAELGLFDVPFAELVGVTLHAFEHDYGQRTISMTELVRLSRALDLSLDELVLTEAVPAAPPAAGNAARPVRTRTPRWCWRCWPPTAGWQSGGH
jgi:hypothetical protein